MALWQHDTTGERFDDGKNEKPGEVSFDRSIAKAHFVTDNFSYVGTPNWVQPVPTPLPSK